VQITHFCNSCISIEAGDTRLLCDPWFGPAAENAWLSFPFGENDRNIPARLRSNIIYISHLHPDHHDQHTLEHVSRETTILIKKFKDGRLKSKLEAQDFHHILEIDAWTPLTLENDLEVVIVPSTSMVKDEIDTAINYDIDTSLLVRCVKTNQVFYNNVDNPTSLKALREIREFSEKTWSKPTDIACLPVGAASEYPQCFLNIDRHAAARRVINAALNELPERIDALGCRNFFLAGGTYVIRGKHNTLSSFIAQPTFEETENYLQPWISAGNHLFALEGGHGVRCHSDDSGFELAETGFEANVDPITGKSDYTRTAARMYYDYSDAVGKAEEYLTRMADALPRAKENYSTVMSRIGIAQDWDTEINLYENTELDAAGKMAESLPILQTITLPSATSNSRQTLALHMDIGLFVDLIEGRGSWNVSLSGSYILYERTPDFFLPDIPFSLNFLVDRSKNYDP
jgi:hypothetical protein